MTMKRLFLTFFALVLSLGLGMTSAEAKRLGGGKSFGMQRDSAPVKQSAPTTSPSATPTGPGAAAAAQPARRSWLGPVAGLAAGLGLAALASHLGFGEEMGQIMLIALLAIAALMLFRFFMRRRQQPAMGVQYAGAGAAGGHAPIPAQTQPLGGSFPQAQTPTRAPIPAGFDAEGFVRQAKLNFLRLQAANDTGNLDDLRTFTSPEVFAEIQMQLRERGAGKQHTEVIDLHGEVLECIEEAHRYVVSVRFHGLLREEAGAPPQDFAEIWHLTKPVAGDQGWTVAGIQQIG
jgi:predicted lipid-binding transport protein (Tim44 family)